MGPEDQEEFDHIDGDSLSDFQELVDDQLEGGDSDEGGSDSGDEE